MKRSMITIVALLLAVFLSACGCTNRVNDVTTPTTKPTTAPTTEPIVSMPDMTVPSTNIPDPTVDSNSTMSTDGETTTTDTSPARNMR